MKTYASQIIFSIKCDGTFTGQYDEQWRLVYADTEQEAIEQSKVLANKQDNIIDRHGRFISWELIAIKDIKELQIEHGTLLSSAVIDVTPIAAPVWQQEYS
jgi:hypothetical protein